MTPVYSKRPSFHLPSATRGKANTQVQSQIDPTHLNALSIDSNKFINQRDRPQNLRRQGKKNRYANIWAQERENLIKRNRQNEEMKGMLHIQKQELTQQNKLHQLVKDKELQEMQRRIKSYNEDLQKEADQRNAKRNKEIAIMEESKELYQRNLFLRKQMEQLEAMKEDPKYLEDREMQERELSRKRSAERKVLDHYYKQNMVQKRR